MRVLLRTRVVFGALLLLGVLASSSFSQAKPSRARSAPPKSTAPEPGSPTPPPEAPQKIEACTLTLEQAPKLRGFYVNQPAESISKIFPSFQHAYEKDPLIPPRALTSDFRVVDSDELTEDFSKLDEYRDVSFVWKLLNGRTVSLIVEYGEYEPASLRDFIIQVVEATSLPLSSFKVAGKHKALMTCDGFTVELHEGSYDKTGWVHSGSQIVIEDTIALNAMAAEEKEIKRLAAEEAARKKEEVEKRKRTFKP